MGSVAVAEVAGYGYGYGSGYGYGYGSGVGVGDGYGDGDGSGDGSGYGYGYGSGVGDGYGSGYGYGYGSGVGVGDGYGDGDGRELGEYMGLVDFPASLALAIPNAELRREAIQRLGPDRFFSELTPEVIHEDTDGAGNPRSLLRIPMQDAELGYLAAVRVVRPTTGRVYHLFPDQRATTCQEAVASTFGLPADQYNPERES